ncbi:hypothetical protein [Clostridium folliculivorans]|uniref:hypothetical protein n=1 Tax=Clostridium folliculivorans TaxID=2886038 RepID=UPI0021C43A9C|nr:hypothetical protein [Clostridium folliculivorans]GKU30336.1 hypothetical protein CFB3_24430 [Clostridium folliculivorans]
MYNNQYPYFPYYINLPTYPVFNELWRSETPKFASFSGIVRRIDAFYPAPNDPSADCYFLMSLESKEYGPLNFVISPGTYFVDHEVVEVGDEVTGFYDATKPAILIYPPQFPAVVVSKNKSHQNVTVNYFNNDLISSNGMLKLNISPSTEVFLTNDQPFERPLENRNLVVIYGPTTKSIPAQTTPYRIIVLCQTCI